MLIKMWFFYLNNIIIIICGLIFIFDLNNLNKNIHGWNKRFFKHVLKNRMLDK